MSKNKSLSLSAIHKESAKLNEKFTVQIKNGKYEIIVNKYFKKTDTPKIVGDFISIVEELKQNGANILGYDNILFLIPVLIAKYMTNIPLPESSLELLSYIGELINLDLLDEIINSLPEDEVEKAKLLIEESFKKLPEMMPQLLDIMKQTGMLELEEVESVEKVD